MSIPICVTLQDIYDAHKVLEPLLPKTPLVRNEALSKIYECDLYLKLETFQPIGSFKIRGATYRISKLTEEERKKGVIAASAGNHAQGVAWGSRRLGVNALIVMPAEAPLVKVQNTQALGASIHQEGANYDAAYDAAQRICAETGRIYIHAFRDPAIIAGQGTIALEILEQLPDVDVVVCSLGGGGMAAGIGVTLKGLKPTTRLIACQAAGADSMKQSFDQGVAVTLEKVATFADGVAVRKANPEMFEFLKGRIDEVLEADDEEIAAAVLVLMEKAKLVSEGSGALPLAVLEQMREQIRGKKIVLVISGGNIDVNLLNRITDRGLTRAGRRLRVNVWIQDRPGMLLALTDLLAKERVNILQAIHDRNEPSTRIDQTEVSLTLETRGVEHSARIIELLRSKTQRVEVRS